MPTESQPLKSTRYILERFIGPEGFAGTVDDADAWYSYRTIDESMYYERGKTLLDLAKKILSEWRVKRPNFKFRLVEVTEETKTTRQVLDL